MWLENGMLGSWARRIMKRTMGCDGGALVLHFIKREKERRRKRRGEKLQRIVEESEWSIE